MTLGNIRNWIPRPIFRFFHRWLGVATILLGWYTCSLGARLLSNIERMLKVPTMTHGGMFLILVFVWLMQRNHSKSRIDTKTRFSV
jgi:SNF family Na+-dependent transporter